jgi:hypothetical protein
MRTPATQAKLVNVNLLLVNDTNFEESERLNAACVDTCEFAFNTTEEEEMIAYEFVLIHIGVR